MAAALIRIRNGYRDQVPQYLAALSNDPRYQDTVLVCQDGIVRASRFVLALAVPMLKRPLKGREEEEVVILMPNFATHEVKHAMGMVFMASGITYEKQDVKNHPEEHKSSILESESNIENRVVKAKDEDFHDIKYEVDSDHGQNVEYTDDGWEIYNNGIETKKVERRTKAFKYENDSEDDGDNIDDDWEQSDDWSDTPIKQKKSRKKNISEIENTNFDCCICDKTFTSRADYKKHESENHVKDGMIVCPYPNCDKKYKATETRYGQSKLIVRHILRHKGKQEEESFVCPECGKTFKNRGSLRPHMALHKGEKTIHCDECDSSYYTTSALLSHKMRQHDDQAEVICPECGKTCSNKYTLKRHMIRHTGERQFKCDWEGCGKSFYDSQVLKVHEKLHLDLKEFQCSLCPKQFRQSQHLVVHMKRHQGVSCQFNLILTLVFVKGKPYEQCS